MAEEYTKSADGKLVVSEVRTSVYSVDMVALLANKAFLENEIRNLNTDLVAANKRIEEAEKLGIKLTAAVAEEPV